MTWQTSYSRYSTFFRCPRYRYLGYHAGSHGLGYRRITRSVPLETGTSVHAALEDICRVIQQDGGADDTIVRMAASRAVTAYNKTVKEAGLAVEGLTADQADALDFIRQEQAHLIECLVWAWWLQMRETVLKWEILHIEHWTREELAGVLLRSRLDLVIEENDGVYLVDWKTTKSIQDLDWWASTWLDSPQLATQTMTWESTHPDIPLAGYYMVGLDKGGRGKFKKRDGRETPQDRQYSSLCYATIYPPSPPQTTATTYDIGKGTWYDRDPVWQAEIPDLPADQSLAEWWVKGLPKKTLQNTVVLAGPYAKQTSAIAALREEIPAVELGILANLHKLHERPTEEHLNQLFPRSYNCHAFGERCEYYGPCREGRNWDGFKEREEVKE